ncbi:hypothetical protein EVAR_50128_1 [Eumeta japonica]|uniref:Uncharacterized protein n=1 Tax=Eumeta variegata TaxID=151549 RepID=A0A4C1YV85_EUMVA|nr:hypothetical protein EVAR_50128_1 [Eumeta japonica]
MSKLNDNDGISGRHSDWLAGSIAKREAPNAGFVVEEQIRRSAVGCVLHFNACCGKRRRTAAVPLDICKSNTRLNIKSLVASLSLCNAEVNINKRLIGLTKPKCQSSGKQRSFPRAGAGRAQGGRHAAGHASRRAGGGYATEERGTTVEAVAVAVTAPLGVLLDP